VFKNHRQLGRPCLLGYIGKCSAPCIGRVSAEEHRAIADDFCQFVSGQAAPMIKRLEREMRAASDAMEYERAARLRDDLGALQRAMEQNAVVFRDGTDADVIALAEDPLEVAVQIFHVRGGRIRGQRGWVADRFEESGSDELIEQFLLQLYAEADPTTTDRDAVPREILVPAMPSSAESLTRMLEDRRGSHVDIRVPQRGDKRALMETVARNARETLVKHKTTRAGDLSTRNRALEEIQEALELPTVPLRIECFDISNLQGTEVVASMVVFEDGLPRKSEYRRFVIRHVDGQNDVAAMHEVITRRFRRLIDDRAAMHPAEPDGGSADAGLDEGPLLIDPTTGAPRRFAYAPSLVVVDGGPPQVAAAAKAMDELGISDIALCGLAKRLEEVWLPDVDEPLILPRTSEGLYLLQRVRDEAHRFAITHHRSRRSKSMVESLLDQVPGLGEVRRKALITYFGSLRKLRAASVEEIAAVPGFGPKLAASIKVALEERPQGEAIDMATGEVLTSS
jgi:excinuclease ABC subunit C